MPISNIAQRTTPRPSPRTAEPEQVVAATFDVVPSAYFARKGWIDRWLAVMLLIPGLPLIGLLMVLVRLTSRGPAIFRQSRVGKDGRVFTMFKIRTMRNDAEKELGATWSTSNDPRSTRLGRLIRKLHLDELPQLLNVLRGEMSLVGPRPERPEFVCVLEEALPGYRNRVTVSPGVTGLAQLYLPPDTDLCSACRKLTLDLEYVRTATLGMDLRLLLSTFLRLPKLPLRLVLRLVALPAECAAPECSACNVFRCNGHNGHSNMTATALKTKVEKSIHGANGKPHPVPAPNGQ
ncbi:MAG: sugar transferase, partial [Patescibacteria group bacterium]|nr:sugar transferase [Patescibacteria group bacterium]